MKKIADDIAYIGVDDLKLDLFENQYPLEEGISYNSYIIIDDKIAVLDTVDAACASDWRANLAEALGGRKPDYLIVQHVEPDHSGLIDWMYAEYPDLQIVASAKAISFISQFFSGLDVSSRAVTVKEGDTLSLGRHTLQFIGAPMVHWPEVITTYDSLSKTIFSADAFGKFGALSKCGFFGEDDCDWACEARRYYFNICGKYGNPVSTLLGKLSKLDIQTICPLHGPILRTNLEYYLNLYTTWSSYGVETDGVFIAYASIHGGTEKAAQQLASILEAKGCPKVSIADLCRTDMAEDIEDAFRYGKMVVAASTYDGTLFPPMHSFLWHLQIKSYQKRTVAIIENGSWAPQAGKVMKEMLSAMKDVNVLEPIVTIKSAPDASTTAALETLAETLL